MMGVGAAEQPPLRDAGAGAAWVTRTPDLRITNAEARNHRWFQVRGLK
jgi:hypothetical protein